MPDRCERRRHQRPQSSMGMQNVPRVESTDANTNDYWAVENDHRDVLRPLLGKSQRSSTGDSHEKVRRGGIDPSMTIELCKYHRNRGCGAVCQWEDPRHRASRRLAGATFHTQQAWMSQMKSRHIESPSRLPANMSYATEHRSEHL